MKKIILLSILSLCYASVSSQAPEKFSYQAVVRDASGNIRSNVSVVVQLSILQGSVTGTAVYSESHSVQTNAFGLVNLALGGGTVEGGTFSTIDWAAGPYFVKVRVDGVEYGTTQLLSVPYAMYAKKAANVFSGNYNDLTNKPVLFDGTWNSLTGKPAFATVATSGNYNDLLNKPVLFDGTWASLTGKPATFPPSAHTHPVGEITGILPVSSGGTGATTAAAARTNLGATTAGSGLFTLPNPSAIRFLRINADNTVSARTAAEFVQDIEAGTVTNIITNNGITGGPVTTTGTIGLTGQALALHNLSTNGFIVRTGSGTVAARSLNAGSGIAITNPDGVSGAPTISARTYSVGDWAFGGIVFWVDATGQHGLVCAKSDQDGGSGVRWYAGTSVSTVAFGEGPMAGAANTLLIIAVQGIGDGSTYAARISNEVQITENSKTYSDWYLPSRAELYLMYENRTAINATATFNGGTAFASAAYWSSTEYSESMSRYVNFSNGSHGWATKSFQYRVRVVRQF